MEGLKVLISHGGSMMDHGMFAEKKNVVLR